MTLLVLLAPAAHAQSCTTGTGGTATCTVDASVMITIARTTQLQVTAPVPLPLLPASGAIRPADFAAGGFDVATVVTVVARSNAPWGATLSAATATFAAPCAGKPASALLWGRSTSTRTTPMSLTPTSVFASSTNAPTAGSSQTLYFRLTMSWTADPPRTCALGLDFAITAP